MPVGLHAPVEGTFFAEAGNGPSQNMQADAVYMRCKDIGKRKDDSPDLLTFDYINDGYLDQKYFPFDGKMLQPGYQSPIVAVKIKGIEVTLLYLLHFLILWFRMRKSIEFDVTHMLKISSSTTRTISVRSHLRSVMNGLSIVHQMNKRSI